MRNRAYALLWCSQVVSQLGDRFHWVAISLWVYAQSSSALSVSYALTALMLGPVVVGLPAGALIDRLDRKTVLVAADLVRAVLVALIPWLMGIDIHLVYLDLFLISCATAFFRPAALASIPRLVSASSYLSATALFTVSDTASDVIGPAIAGAASGLIGYAGLLYIDAISYLISAFLLLFLPHIPPRAQQQTMRAPFWRDIVKGLKFIRNDRLQLALVFLLLGWVLAGFSSLQTPLVKTELGLTDTQFGIFSSAMGLGFLAGSLTSGLIPQALSKSGLVIFSFTGWILFTGLAAFTRNEFELYATSFGYGASNMFLVIAIGSLLMERTPSEFLGRVLSTRQVCLAIVRFMALISVGIVGDWIGVRLTIFGISLLASVILLLSVSLFSDIYLQDIRRAARRIASSIAQILSPVLTKQDLSYPQGQEMVNACVVAMVLVCVAVVSWRAIGLLMYPVLLILLASVGRGALAALRKLGSKFKGQVGGQSRKEPRGDGTKSMATGPTS
jgi:NRE family putative nickel resistance protein-like MFS transporter